ncbi:MAG: hypothetical protein PF448_04785 [Bacteroidales bacterium]|jgi:hypothetical protein|nr:hypothetical protein [Bacteroidales bacterium]
MKLRALISILIVFIAFACNTGKENEDTQAKEALISELKTENENLQNKAENAEQSLNDFMQAFNDINQNLEEIKRKEDVISLTAKNMEFGMNGAEKIQEDILLIYDLLEENKATVVELRSKMEAGDMLNEDMQRSLYLLGRSVDKKNEQISALRSRLENMNFEMQALNESLDSLMLANQIQHKKLKAQEDILNTGYFIIGSSRELFNLGVTTRKGGFAGIGSITQIDEYFESRLFKKLNIYKTRRIPLKSKKVRILSTHPAHTYKFDGPTDYYNNLIITRPEQFWATSRYLVIEVD